MKSERFFELLQDTDEELILRAEKVDSHPKKKKSLWLKWGAAAACFCLIVSAAFAVAPLFHRGKPNPDSVLPVAPDQIIWADVEVTKPDWKVPLWNGWKVNYWLYRALETAEDDRYLAVVVIKSFDEHAKETFLYEGRTYNQMWAEYVETEALFSRLGELLKDGDCLKYGEALYTTGTPDGERWAKELYLERVAYYGEEILSAYISSGVFDKEKVQTDLDAAENQLNELSNIMIECREKYQNSMTAEERQSFTESGICTHDENGRFYLFIQKNQLLHLDSALKDNYFLILASREAFDNPDNLAGPIPEPE